MLLPLIQVLPVSSKPRITFITVLFLIIRRLPYQLNFCPVFFCSTLYFGPQIPLFPYWFFSPVLLFLFWTQESPISVSFLSCCFYFGPQNTLFLYTVCRDILTATKATGFAFGPPQRRLATQVELSVVHRKSSQGSHVYDLPIKIRITLQTTECSYSTAEEVFFLV